MVTKAPGYSKDTQCIKWDQSEHCRTEFREVVPAKWDPNTASGTHRMHVKLLGARGKSVCIGQVFQVDNGANKPFAELYYSSDGTLTMGVARCKGGVKEDPQNCQQHMQPLGKVPLNTIFTYDIRFEKGKLWAGINGDVRQLETHFSTPKASFKMGNYNQETDEASIHVFEFTTEHVN